MFRLCLALAFFCIIGTSSTGLAGSLYALVANFDADVVGEAPDTNLPGEPSGDYLYYYGAANGVCEVISGVSTMIGQPLRAERTANSYIVRFALDPELNNCESYVIRWTAMYDEEQFASAFSLRSSSQQLLAAVGVTGSSLTAVYGSTSVTLAGQSSAVNRVIDYEINLNLEESTFSLAIDGAPVPEVQDVLALGADFARFEISYGGTGVQYVYIDDISVWANCSSVATDKIKWGEIKAIYR